MSSSFDPTAKVKRHNDLGFLWQPSNTLPPGSPIPSLLALCQKTLVKNLHMLYEIGCVPAELLEPVISEATAAQLVNIEDSNPGLDYGTDARWRTLCQNKWKVDTSDGLGKWALTSWRAVYEALQRDQHEQFERSAQLARQRTNEGMKEKKSKSVGYVSVREAAEIEKRGRRKRKGGYTSTRRKGGSGWGKTPSALLASTSYKSEGMKSVLVEARKSTEFRNATLSKQRRRIRAVANLRVPDSKAAAAALEQPPPSRTISMSSGRNKPAPKKLSSALRSPRGDKAILSGRTGSSKLDRVAKLRAQGSGKSMSAGTTNTLVSGVTPSPEATTTADHLWAAVSGKASSSSGSSNGKSGLFLDSVPPAHVKLNPNAPPLKLPLPGTRQSRRGVSGGEGVSEGRRVSGSSQRVSVSRGGSGSEGFERGTQSSGSSVGKKKKKKKRKSGGTAVVDDIFGFGQLKPASERGSGSSGGKAVGGVERGTQSVSNSGGSRKETKKRRSSAGAELDDVFGFGQLKPKRCKDGEAGKVRGKSGVVPRSSSRGVGSRRKSCDVTTATTKTATTSTTTAAASSSSTSVRASHRTTTTRPTTTGVKAHATTHSRTHAPKSTSSTAATKRAHSNSTPIHTATPTDSHARTRVSSATSTNQRERVRHSWESTHARSRTKSRSKSKKKESAVPDDLFGFGELRKSGKRGGGAVEGEPKAKRARA